MQSDNVFAAPSDSQSQSSISVSNTGNSFIDLAYSIPTIASNADSYITSLVSKKLAANFSPTFFQIPYIYSAADNLIKGKYTSSTSNDGNNVITTYKISYQGEFKEEVATIVTYSDVTTGILFYEIPREFSYNSVDQASIAYSLTADGNYDGLVNIPSSFVSNVNDSIYEFKFNIKTDINSTNAIVSTDAKSGEPPKKCVNPLRITNILNDIKTNCPDLNYKCLVTQAVKLYQTYGTIIVPGSPIVLPCTNTTVNGSKIVWPSKAELIKNYNAKPGDFGK